MKDQGKIKSLQQIRAMAHPIRMRLLEAFSHGPATAKQVAEQIGEPPTRLYHHVNVLKRVGLIKLVKTNEKRGTTEKYYRTVADQFVVDRSLFDMKSGGKEVLSRLQRMTFGIFEDAMTEIRESLASRRMQAKGKGGDFVFAHTHINATPAQIVALQKKINDLIKQQGLAKREKGSVRYGAVLALYRTHGKSDKKKRGEK